MDLGYGCGKILKGERLQNVKHYKSEKCGKYVQEAMTNMNETIFTYLKLNVKSQEMFKVNIQNNAFSNKSEYQKSKSRKETQ